jgi:hypothetical protein
MKKITNEEFAHYLEKEVALLSAATLLSWGDVYTALAEHLNNQVIEAWEKDNKPKRISFDAMWTEKLGEAIKERSTDPYPIEMHPGNDYKALAEAINQGIDSHLEAVACKQSPGSHGRSRIVIEPQTLHVLVRRLMESGNEDAESLASGICEPLDIELI